MQIINNQLLAEDGVTVIEDLPLLAHDATLRVWEVPTEYRANGFYISTGNDIPACDHGDPVFSAELKADETIKLTNEANQIVDRLTGAVQNHLDESVKIRGYDNMISASTYSTSSNTKFKADGIAAVKWRDAVWGFCYALLDEVKAGTKSVPTEEELIAALPLLNW